MIHFPGTRAESKIDALFMLSGSLFAEAKALRASASTLSFHYLLRVKSALLSPDTVTGFDWFFTPSCQAVTV